jgi:hypothetical protein
MYVYAASATHNRLLLKQALMMLQLATQLLPQLLICMLLLLLQLALLLQLQKLLPLRYKWTLLWAI